MRLRRARPSQGATTKLFFTTDIHGSDVCFRKFLNAGKFYGASALILGGDITGKSLVPIERTPRGWSATFNDHVYTDIGEDEREALEQSVRDHGAYPVVGDRDELLRLEDEEHRESVFIDAVVEQHHGLGRNRRAAPRRNRHPLLRHPWQRRLLGDRRTP